MHLNYSGIALSGLGVTVGYFACGGLLFGLLPQLRTEFSKYPAVYRSEEGIKAVMPVGMAAMFLSILTLAVIYALAYQGGSGVAEGARFGALIGGFALRAFVLHHYVNLTIGGQNKLGQSLGYFFVWTIVVIVIRLIYQPTAN